MNQKLFFLLVLFTTLNAFADNGGTNAGKFQNKPSDAEEQGGAIAVEVAANAFGNLGDNVTPSTHGSALRRTDWGISVAARKHVSDEFALSLSIPLYAAATHNNAQANLSQGVSEQVAILPASIGARYQLSFYDHLKPYAQVEVGEALLDDSSTGKGGVSSLPQQLRFLSKFSGGLDYYFEKQNGVYAGVQVGYLAIRDFSSLNTSLNMGYAF